MIIRCEQMSIAQLVIIDSMLKSEKLNFSAVHLALVQHLSALFLRQSLINNTYLFKHMTPNLTLPLFAIAEERKIAQITASEQTILEALRDMQNVKVSEDGRKVELKQWPTVKINRENSSQIIAALKQKNLKFEISERGDGTFALSICTESPNIFATALPNYKLEPVSLYEDMKAGVARIKKLKNQHTKSRNDKYHPKYSLDKPPMIFIRKAVDSQDESEYPNNEQSQQHHQNGSTLNNHHNEQSTQTNNKKKKYKQAPSKPIINQDEFPSLC